MHLHLAQKKVNSRLRRELPESHRASTGRIVGLCIGLASVILMLYFGFMSPTVIARWTGYSYAATIAVLGVTLTIFAFLMSTRPWSGDHSPFWSARVIKVWNALFIAMLVLTILPHQIGFPANSNAYPIDAPMVSPWAVSAVLPDARSFPRDLH